MRRSWKPRDGGWLKIPRGLNYAPYQSLIPVPPPLAAGLPRMLLITGDALDSTPPHNSTLGDDI